jgi:hypothetical protein
MWKDWIVVIRQKEFWVKHTAPPRCELLFKSGQNWNRLKKANWLDPEEYKTLLEGEAFAVANGVLNGNDLLDI